MLSQDIRPYEDVLDEAYRKYAHSDPFMPITHFIDHATMGAEALTELGLGSRVKEWMARHRTRPYTPPEKHISILTAWRQALGQRECHGDFLKYFEGELAARPYQVVLADWVPRFAHEVGAFLFHGLIRTAHATRALEYKDTPQRRNELARGLSLWAIGIHTPPPEAPGPEIAAASDIMHFARMGAAAFICDPNIPKLHLVTGAMAYLIVAPYLDGRTHELARASFAKTHVDANKHFDALKERAYAEPNVALTSEHLLELAMQTDAHPIKLTEAALRAHRQSQDEIFLKAAAKALDIHRLRALFGVAKSMMQRRVA